jgi:hypothetical protein
MPLMTPGKCWRNRDDCESMASVEAMDASVTEEQMANLDFDPPSFVCCGCIKVEARKIPQDAYRLCFKNAVTDEMTDNDDQDLTHLGYVISQAQAIIASRRVNRGHIDVMGGDYDMISVETRQKLPEPDDDTSN